MYVKNKNGRIITLEVFGSNIDDVLIDELYYIDNDQLLLEIVTDEDIEYILNNYSFEIEEELRNRTLTLKESA